MKRTSSWARQMWAASLVIAGCGTAPSDPQVNSGTIKAKAPAALHEQDDDPRPPPVGVTTTAETPNGGVVTYRRFAEASSTKIIGTNELTPVVNDGANLPAALQPLIDAFGMIDMGCTATHIGNGLVLTAGHCFDAPATPATDVSCAGHTIDWGVRKDKPKYLTSTCQVIVAEQLNDDIDYAILRVSPVPPVSVAVDLSARVSNDTNVTIFGFPQMRPLEWSQYCTVQPGSRGNWGAAQFSHQCDTEPGNSGSTVIDSQTLKVIGIHDGGLVPWNYASYLFDTPLASIIGGGGTSGGSSGGSTGGSTGSTTGGTDVPNQTWGPFGDNLDKTLITIGNNYNGRISFQLSYDVEANYDFVFVTDGNGKARKYTGKASRRFTGSAALKAPVVIRFVSDESVSSTSVGVNAVEFH